MVAWHSYLAEFAKFHTWLIGVDNGNWCNIVSLVYFSPGVTLLLVFVQYVNGLFHASTNFTNSIDLCPLVSWIYLLVIKAYFLHIIFHKLEVFTISTVVVFPKAELIANYWHLNPFPFSSLHKWAFTFLYPLDFWKE